MSSSGAPGGAGGTSSDRDGGGGALGLNGGGGGGGAHGSIVIGADSNSGSLAGGDGGSGGVATDANGGGGGGGGGGHGVVLDGTNLSYANSDSGTISGGHGGNGGTGGPGGGGGSGGMGMLFTDGGTLDNDGSISGGNGGSGAASSSSGSGGAGISGGNLSIINKGAISGGLMGGAGATRTDALRFTGGDNILALEGSGWSLNGNIAIQSGTLTFSQSSDQIVANTVTGGGNLIQGGAGTLTLTGANTYSGGTTINSGSALEVGHNNALGSGVVTMADAGTLSFGDDGLNLANDFELNEVSIFLVAPGQTGTISGAISDDPSPGMLFIDGGGTLELTSANNTYTGVTWIEDGVLKLSGAGSIANSSRLSICACGTFDISATDNGATIQSLEGADLAVVELGDRTLTLNNADGDYAYYGIIQGTGGLAINGGVQVLSGASTYEGGTALNGGRLVIEADENLGASSGGISFNGGTLETIKGFTSDRAITLTGAGAIQTDVHSDGSTLTLNGVISGPGSLAKTGTGTLILTGANSYTGGTTVAAGMLVGDTSSISGNIGNAATLVFDQTDNASFTGHVVGLSGADGTMVKRGVGVLTLDGFSSLDWTIEAGGLVANAGQFWGDADIAGAATLTFDQSSAATYAGVLSGAGGFTVDGAGAVTLTGYSAAFTGTTTVSNGSLIVGTSSGGALGGTVNVGPGGLLGGTGTVGSPGSTVMIAAEGVHAPGNSIGSQTVAGNYVNHGTMRIEATPAGADRIEVAGSVDITGATLDLVLSPTDAASWDIFNGPYTIIEKTSAGGVVGTFVEPYTQNLLFLDALVAYDGGDDGNDVTLELQRNGLAFAGVGNTANQIATGTAVDTLDNGHAVWRSIALSNDQDIVRASFDALSGEIHASAKTALIEDSRFVRNAINDRIRAAFGDAGASETPVLAYDPGDNPVLVAADPAGPALWVNGFGSWGSTDSDGNAASLVRSTGGLLMGTDGMAGDWRIGLFAGYSHSSFKANDRNASGSSDNYHLGLYGGRQWGNLAFRSGMAAAWHDIDTERTVALPGLTDHLAASYRARSILAFGEVGYRFDLTNSARMEPFANFTHVHLSTDGFTETGDAAALTAATSDTDFSFVTLGLRASNQFALGTVLGTVHATAGWRHGLGDLASTSTMAFASGSDSFTITGTAPARDTALIQAGLDLNLSETSTIGFSYDGQLFRGATNSLISGNINVKF